jgi:predicted amidohydrolase
MRIHRTIFGLGLSLAALVSVAAPATHLKVAVIQRPAHDTLVRTRAAILAWIDKAAAKGARVVVFPEGALSNEIASEAPLEAAIATIRESARAHRVYVISGAAGYSSVTGASANLMFVAGPDGREIFRYHKLYDQRGAPMPGVFLIDGVPCNTMICADRWLRGIEEVPIQEGARISFELSGNSSAEWIPEYQWYWYVPRALRNNVWVIFSNTGVLPPSADFKSARGHGHSAIISPQGQIVAAAGAESEAMIMADLDVAQATGQAAMERARNPVLHPFWDAGIRLQKGEAVAAPPLTPLEPPETSLTLAAAQVMKDVPAMEAAIADAHKKDADLIAFPAASAAETDLPRLQTAAKANAITVVFGAVHPEAGARRNSAFVLGPDGQLITRYDQISALPPYQPGTSTAAMWFSVKGVPAIVTVGRDALWTELAEMSAVAGARVLVHLDDDPDASPAATLRRNQVWINCASFQTFTVTANPVGSAIWDDLLGGQETSAQVKGRPRPDSGACEVYSPWSANLVVNATADTALIMATRTIPPGVNPHHPFQTTRYNPQMDAWYRLGAHLVHPQ